MVAQAPHPAPIPPPTTPAHWLHSGPDLILGLAHGQQAPRDELIYDVSLHTTDGIQPSLIPKLSEEQSSCLWGPCPELGVTSLKGHNKSKNYFVLCGMLFIKHFT